MKYCTELLRRSQAGSAPSRSSDSAPAPPTLGGEGKGTMNLAGTSDVIDGSINKSSSGGFINWREL